MTETSRFWDGTTLGDATVSPYDAATEFSLVLAALTGTEGFTDKGGVWRDSLGGLVALSPAANTVRIGPGRAMVYGTWYQNDANVDINIPTPGGATRIDRIVLRKSWTAQTVRITRIAGTEGTGLAPAMTQTIGTTWDFPLCNVSITTGAVITITDQRAFINPGGAAAGTNHLINGGMEISQRGVGPFTANLAYTLDEWQISTAGGASCSIAPDTVNVDAGSAQSLAFTYTHAPGGSVLLQQKLESASARFGGRIISLSFRVKTNIAGTFAVRISGSATPTVVSAYHTGDNTWQTLTCSVRVLAGESNLWVMLLSNTASGTAYFDNGMLVVGPLPAEYSPLTPAEEWTRCMRYYERHDVNFRFNCGASTVYDYPLSWRTLKAIAPTVTVSAGTRNNITSVSMSTMSIYGGFLEYAITSINTDTFARNGGTPEYTLAEGHP